MRPGRPVEYALSEDHLGSCIPKPPQAQQGLEVRRRLEPGSPDWADGPARKPADESVSDLGHRDHPGEPLSTLAQKESRMRFPQKLPF